MIFEIIFGLFCLFSGTVCGYIIRDEASEKKYLKKYIPIKWIQSQIETHPGMASAMWTRLIDEWEKTI